MIKQYYLQKTHSNTDACSELIFAGSGITHAAEVFAQTCAKIQDDSSYDIVALLLFHPTALVITTLEEYEWLPDD